MLTFMLTFNLSQHYFLGCKSFSSWWVHCIILWQYSNASSPVLGHLKGKRHRLLTSLHCRRSSSLTTPALTEPSLVNLQQCGSFAIEKIQLLIQTCLLRRPTYISKITAKAQWLSTPTTYRNASKTIFHLYFATKGALKCVRIFMLT